MSAAKAKTVLAALLAALPAFWLAGYLGYVLFDPLASPGTRQWAVDAGMLMVMEFLLVHAGFLSILAMVQETLKQRAIFAGALSSFYLMMMVFFWFMTKGSMAVLVALGLLASRMVSGVILGAEGVRQRGLVPVINVVLYLVLVIITTVPQRFPEFGFTPEVIAAIRPAPDGPSSVWDEMPQRAVAFGALYFLLQGVICLITVKNRPPEAADNRYLDERQRQSPAHPQGPSRRPRRSR